MASVTPLASLLAQTVGIKVAQRQLRHSNARTTLAICTDILGTNTGKECSVWNRYFWLTIGTIRYLAILAGNN